MKDTKERQILYLIGVIFLCVIISMPIIEYIYILTNAKTVIETISVTEEDLQRVQPQNILLQTKQIETKNYVMYITNKEYNNLKDGDTLEITKFRMNKEQKSLAYIRQEILLFDITIWIVIVGIYTEKKKQINNNSKD